MTAEDIRFSPLETPCLLLDEAKMLVNISRLAERTSALGVALRPHLKTAKSLDVAKLLLTGGDGPATVSTLAEAEAFAEAGLKDILYAVGIAPQKLARVAVIRAKGCDLTVILDSAEQVEAVVAASKACGQAIPALIEIDCDGHRGGLLPDDPALVALGLRLQEGGAELRGVITHAGESYGVYGDDAHAEFAERERAAAVAAAQNLRAAGLACPVVSVGSTPTAHAARDLTGVTEVRAGVYVFFDLVMAGIGVCKPQDIALSVLTTVIGHQREKGWILIDAGWMALSRDRSTANQKVDQGYGIVCDENGNIFDDLIVTLVNQEHGIIMRRPGSTRPVPDVPLGARLRILPNHACATASQFPAYTVIPAEAMQPLKNWKRISGW
jgi:D-serine deaminase-like pyridoxal phosphate-dependent protein